MKIHIDAITRAMRSLWNFPEDVIMEVGKHFGDLNDTYIYLEMMDNLDVVEPKDAWTEYCIDNNIEHEIEVNPFVTTVKAKKKKEFGKGSIKYYIGDTIKIGRREFVIKSGDYIMDNNTSVLCFCAGDRRTLYHTKNGRYYNNHTYISMPRKVSVKLNLSNLIGVRKSPNLINYKFTEKPKS